MAANLFTELQDLHPWMRDLGLSATWLQTAIAESGSNASELAARIRGTTQYKRRFQGMYRTDGTQRWTEAQHIQREDGIRNLLRQYGINVQQEYSTRESLIGFHESEQSLDEVRDRLEVWNFVKTSGQTVKDAFYVYAGLKLQDDDLFEALVDGAREQELFRSYNRGRAQLAPDYASFITRATEVGNQRVANELTNLQKRGVLTGQAVQRILSIDPNFARQMMDAIYTGGDPTPGTAGALDLQHLLSSYEFASIGAAAAEAGLALPTRERLAEIRAAGVDRARAMEGYRNFGRDRSRLASAIQRARGVDFGQTQFEQAEFLGNATQARNLQSGIGYMEARGKTEGSFRFTEERGRLVQTGLRVA
jgi:hypothetical protein